MLTRLEGMARWARKRARRLGLILPQGEDALGYRPTPRFVSRPLSASEQAYRALDQVIGDVTVQYHCGVNLQTDEQMMARWLRGWTDATVPPLSVMTDTYTRDPLGRIMATGLIAWHGAEYGLAPLQAYLSETAYDAVEQEPRIGIWLGDALLTVASRLSLQYQAGIPAAQWSVQEIAGRLHYVEQLPQCEPGYCRGACVERDWACVRRQQVDQIIDARAWLASGGRLVAILPAG